jgi:hypothetical protein
LCHPRVPKRTALSKGTALLERLGVRRVPVK